MNFFDVTAIYWVSQKVHMGFFSHNIIQKNMNKHFSQPNTYTVSIWPGKFSKVIYGLGQPTI